MKAKKIKINEVTKDFSLNVKVSGVKRFKWKWKFVLAWIYVLKVLSPFKVEFELIDSSEKEYEKCQETPEVDA